MTDAGRADRRGDDLVADDDDAQVLAGDELLEQHVGAVLAGQPDRALQRRLVGDADGDALALLAAGRLHDELADLGAGTRASPSSPVAVRPRGTDRPARSQHAAGDALVVAAAHRDGAESAPTATRG